MQALRGVVVTGKERVTGMASGHHEFIMQVQQQQQQWTVQHTLAAFHAIQQLIQPGLPPLPVAAPSAPAAVAAVVAALTKCVHTWLALAQHAQSPPEQRQHAAQQCVPAWQQLVHNCLRCSDGGSSSTTTTSSSSAQVQCTHMYMSQKSQKCW